MAQLDQLETKLDEVLRKKAPIQLPAEARTWIARNAWWLVLIGGLCLLWSALVLWQAGHTIDRFAEMYGSYYIGMPYVHKLGLPYYLSLLSMAGSGVLMLVATTSLKDMRRSGWKNLWYALLLNVLAAVFLLFTHYGGGFAGFLGTLVGTVVGGYFLFQIRDRFTKRDGAATHKK
jgi:hypothetical protein